MVDWTIRLHGNMVQLGGFSPSASTVQARWRRLAPGNQLFRANNESERRGSS
jgi:hypothetical protein